MNMHDAIRHLIHGAAFRDEGEKRQALLAVDAHERGFADAESYQAELDKQGAAQRRETGQESPQEKADRLEAENTRLQALVNAHTANPTPPPTT